MFNIKSLAISPTADMPLRNAAGEKQFDENGAPLTITFYSPATKEYQKIKHAREEVNSTRMVSKMQGKPDGKINWSDKVDERAADLAAVTKSFNGFGAPDGSSLTGFDLFKSVYSDIDLGHIADDAEKFVNDRANFMKPSAKN